MLHDHFVFTYADALQISGECLADGDDLIRLRQQDSVKLVVGPHFQVFPIMATTERQPMVVGMQSRQEDQKVGFYIVSLNNVRLSRLDNPVELRDDANVER